ncbi:MAG: DUF2971 domain-containing protein [bacterium]
MRILHAFFKLVGFCPNSSFPEYLYKYRSWSDASHRRLLTHNEIYFAAAKELNDPFEAIIPVRHDLLSKRQKLKIIEKHIKIENPNAAKKEIRKRAEIILAEGHYRDPENLAETRRQKISRFGIFSVAEVEDNLLMWSHYADSHKGFCVGFDVSGLKDYFQGSPDHNMAIELHRIKYYKRPPMINQYKVNPRHTEEAVVESIIMKSSDWAYEKEYRFIAFDDVNVPLRLDDGVIKKVILGCKIPQRDEAEIIQLLKSRSCKVELLKAIMKNGQSGLDITVVPY